jgi:hypothetical protein
MTMAQETLSFRQGQFGHKYRYVNLLGWQKMTRPLYVECILVTAFIRYLRGF